MNEIAKVVSSRTLERAASPGTRIARGETADEIAALELEPGRNMPAWGGAARHVLRPMR